MFDRSDTLEKIKELESVLAWANPTDAGRIAREIVTLKTKAGKARSVKRRQ